MLFYNLLQERAFMKQYIHLKFCTNAYALCAVNLIHEHQYQFRSVADRFQGFKTNDKDIL